MFSPQFNTAIQNVPYIRTFRSRTFQDANVNASPVCQLWYCTTVLFKVLYCQIKNVFFFVLVFLCMYCVKTIISLLQYSPIKLIVLAGCLGWLCWTYQQTGFRNVLLEWNLFVLGDLQYSGWPSSDVPGPCAPWPVLSFSISVNTMAPQGPHLSDEEMGLTCPRSHIGGGGVWRLIANPGGVNSKGHAFYFFGRL